MDELSRFEVEITTPEGTSPCPATDSRSRMIWLRAAFEHPPGGRASRISAPYLVNPSGFAFATETPSSIPSSSNLPGSGSPRPTRRNEKCLND